MKPWTPTDAELNAATPISTEEGLSYKSELVEAAKHYFSAMYKIHETDHHPAFNVTNSDNRTVGWDGHGDLQPGTGIYLITKAIHDRANNPEQYGESGLELQIALKEKARQEPAFRDQLMETALLTLYQEDITNTPKSVIDAKNQELALEREVMGKNEIHAPAASLRHIVAKKQAEIAQEVGVELAPASIGIRQ